MLGGLVMKIEQRFPLVEGEILGVEGGTVTLNVGAKEGVRTGMQFIVIEPGAEQDMESGEIRYLDDAPVELVADRVRGPKTVARILPGSAGRQVRKGDFVHTR